MTLHEYRMRKGYSVMQLAKYLNVSKASIYRWEEWTYSKKVNNAIRDKLPKLYKILEKPSWQRTDHTFKIVAKQIIGMINNELSPTVERDELIEKIKETYNIK